MNYGRLHIILSVNCHLFIHILANVTNVQTIPVEALDTLESIGSGHLGFISLLEQENVKRGHPQGTGKRKTHWPNSLHSRPGPKDNVTVNILKFNLSEPIARRPQETTGEKSPSAVETGKKNKQVCALILTFGNPIGSSSRISSERGMNING